MTRMLTDLGAVLRGVPGEELAEHGAALRVHRLRGHQRVERQLAQQIQRRNQALLHPLDIRTHNQRTSPRIFCVVIGKRLDEKMITLAVVKSKVWFGK